MDIQINAAQGRGKSTLAHAIANAQGSRLYEVAGFEGANISLTKIARDIVEARADVVLFDGAADWSVQHLKEAVQAARQSLRRNIVAIYCITDRGVGVSESAPFIPFGFVNVGSPVMEDAEPLRNTFKAGPLLGTCPDIAGITEQSIGPVKTYTADSMVDLARKIHSLGAPTASDELAQAYKEFGASNVISVPPVFWPSLSVKMLNILNTYGPK